MKNFFIPVIRSYSAILFNPDLKGGIILLVLTFLNPNLGIGGFVSVVSAYILARTLRLNSEFLRLDYYIYNPLLVGLSLGFLFKINMLSIIFFIIGGIFSFLLTYVFSLVFYNYLRIPTLSLPFVVASSMLYLASTKYSNLFVNSLYGYYHILDGFYLPSAIRGYLVSVGSIFFLPNPIAGVVIAIVILYVSRILFFLSITGYLTGAVTTAFLTGSISGAFSDPSAFNFILTSMAIGGVFLIPSKESYSFAALAALISSVVVESAKVFWENYGIPVFAFPFNFTTHLFLFTIFWIGYAKITKIYKGTPERTLDYHITHTRRFPYTGREIFLPFSGRWSVWQSFDGEWTHKGIWRHAVDFVICDEKGETFKNDGAMLEDYYAFGKPVFSPISGYVTEIENGIEDNPPGDVNKSNNWGNYVLLYDNRGFYVLISHFKKNSIKVKKGDYVTKGSILGLCGNSGYSPQPHIHIHVQLYPKIGSPTVDFKFYSYITSNEFVDLGIPAKGDIIEPVVVDKSLLSMLNLQIDQKAEFTIKKGGDKRDFEIQVKMAEDGTFYLTDGRAKLYFGVLHSVFYFYHLEGDLHSPLKYFFFAASKILLSYNEGVLWRDYLPLYSIPRSLKKEMMLFLSAFNHNLFTITTQTRFISQKELERIVNLPSGNTRAYIELSKEFGFKKITFGNIEISLKRRLT